MIVGFIFFKLFVFCLCLYKFMTEFSTVSHFKSLFKEQKKKELIATVDYKIC